MTLRRFLVVSGDVPHEGPLCRSGVDKPGNKRVAYKPLPRLEC